MIVQQRQCDNCGCNLTDNDRRFRMVAHLEFIPANNSSDIVPAANKADVDLEDVCSAKCLQEAIYEAVKKANWS